MNRREFLQNTAAAAAAARLGNAVPAHAAPTTVQNQIQDHAWPENGTLIPDHGWRLWIDRDAQWKDDAIFLPEDISQDASGTVLGEGEPLPIHPPTGGWDVLTAGCPTAETSDLGSASCIPVTLPSTVEQHLWGSFGAAADGKPRPYTPEEYRYAADDPIPQNGAFFGVSWWFRPIEIPPSMRGKRIFLHIRGAHLRAEVYLNQKLVGYSIMEELPFEAELTHAANPGGQNLLAIRITNPFGRFDWVDGLNAQWGAVKLFRSHGFGGLDRGMTITAHGEKIAATSIGNQSAVSNVVRIKDAWVLNLADPHTVQAHVELEHDPYAFTGTLSFEVVDRVTGKVLLKKELGVGDNFVDDRSIATDPAVRAKYAADQAHRPAWITTKWSTELACPDAGLWGLDSPVLYDLRIQFTDPANTDTRTVAFGFRSFAPEGIGSNALFRLNGRRIKIYTAISWGFWGLNGMWPTPELATKEVTQAKNLNLTCLNFHRNLAKEEVLRAHDRLGLLRYMEPGGGKFAIGKLPAGVQASGPSIVMQQPQDEADKFAQRFMFTKCVQMVKAFRSHPSVIEYCLQNEIGADLKNPATIAILEAMRAEDPSRCIVLNDGFVAPPRRAAQAWFAPWDPNLHRSDQEPWGDWWNQHQGAGDQWYDEFYKSPTDFTYRSPYKDVITEFGEMEGCAVPDNHSLMLHQLAAPRATGLGDQPPNHSYDLVDHRDIVTAYDTFLDKWGFRAAFPATERLWLALGKKCYDTWQNYLENARISDWLDFCAISGWESTAIENHSGIVDNLRNYKSAPGPIRDTLLPVRPVAKQRSLCTPLGQPATFDLFLLNDISRPVSGALRFTVVTPSGKLLHLTELPVPPQTPDVFSYLVKEAFLTPPLTEEGMYRFRCALSSAPLATQTKEIWVAGLPKAPRKRILQIGVSGIPSALRTQLNQLAPVLGLSVTDFVANKKFDVIVSSGLVTGASATQNSGDTTGLEAQPAATSAAQASRPGALAPGILEALRAGTPLLAIPQTDPLSEGVARQLAAAGAFTYHGAVGDLRAPWMGNWYFLRRHPIFQGMPVDQAMGTHFQARGREANGLLIDHAPSGGRLEIIAAYSRDHSRLIGAGTFTTTLGRGKLLYHRVPPMHPVLQRRFLANALLWLTT